MTTPVQAEREFVDSFSDALEKVESDAAAAAGVTEGGAAPATKKTAAHVDTVADIPADAGPDDDTDESTDTDTEETPPAEGEETEVEEEAPEEDADEETDGEPDEAKAEAAFQSELKRHGLKMTLDDVPVEARPLVKTALANQQAAFTKAMQEARAYRTEEASFRAEQRYREQHPALAIAEMLKKNPTLIGEVQAHIDSVEDPMGAKYFDGVVKDSRKEASDAIAAEVAHADRLHARGIEVVTYVRRASASLGIPSNVVEQAVTLAILAKPADQRDLTQAEIDAVIQQQARVLKRHTSAVKREHAKKVIQDRTKDRKTTSPAVRAGSGAAPAPSGAKKPANDKEFMDHVLAKMG